MYTITMITVFVGIASAIRSVLRNANRITSYLATYYELLRTLSLEGIRANSHYYGGDLIVNDHWIVYRGPAHSACYLIFKNPRFIPIVWLSYNGKLIIREISAEERNINLLPVPHETHIQEYTWLCTSKHYR